MTINTFTQPQVQPNQNQVIIDENKPISDKPKCSKDMPCMQGFECIETKCVILEKELKAKEGEPCRLVDCKEGLKCIDLFCRKEGEKPPVQEAVEFEGFIIDGMPELKWNSIKGIKIGNKTIKTVEKDNQLLLLACPKAEYGFFVEDPSQKKLFEYKMNPDGIKLWASNNFDAERTVYANNLVKASGVEECLEFLLKKPNTPDETFSKVTFFENVEGENCYREKCIESNFESLLMFTPSYSYTNTYFDMKDFPNDSVTGVDLLKVSLKNNTGLILMNLLITKQMIGSQYTLVLIQEFDVKGKGYSGKEITKATVETRIDFSKNSMEFNFYELGAEKAFVEKTVTGKKIEQEGRSLKIIALSTLQLDFKETEYLTSPAEFFEIMDITELNYNTIPITGSRVAAYIENSSGEIEDMLNE